MCQLPTDVLIEQVEEKEFEGSSQPGSSDKYGRPSVERASVERRVSRAPQLIITINYLG